MTSLSSKGLLNTGTVSGKTAFKQHSSMRRASVNVVFSNDDDHNISDTLPGDETFSSSVGSRSASGQEAQQIRANAMYHLERQINS